MDVVQMITTIGALASALVSIFVLSKHLKQPSRDNAKATNSLNEAMIRLVASANNLSDSLEKVDTRITKHGEEIDEHDKLLARHDERLHSHDKRITKLESK